MQVKILKRGERALVIRDFDQVVIETEGGAPVAVAARFGPDGTFIVSSIDDDPRFQEVLRKLGLHKATIVTDIKDLMKPGSSLPELL